MKRMFVGALAMGCMMALMGTAGFHSIPSLLGADEPSTKNCVGYTIIASDKGIDCKGDTIKLIRKNGFAQREF